MSPPIFLRPRNTKKNVIRIKCGEYQIGAVNMNGGYHAFKKGMQQRVVF